MESVFTSILKVNIPQYWAKIITKKMFTVQKIKSKLEIH